MLPRPSRTTTRTSTVLTRTLKVAGVSRLDTSLLSLGAAPWGGLALESAFAGWSCGGGGLCAGSGLTKIVPEQRRTTTMPYWNTRDGSKRNIHVFGKPASSSAIRQKPAGLLGNAPKPNVAVTIRR